MLAVKNLKKVFSTPQNEIRAVDGVSFEVTHGEFYTLLGPSGCGKTTTLQCIAGLELADAGEILMGGVPVFSSENRIAVPAHRRDIGMVFQSYAIWPHMTVFENVAFPLVYGRTRLPKRLVSRRVLDALALVQLDGLADRPAPFLSGGQQQRVALARAVVQEPKLLLLDEPLSNLDAKLRDEMRFELRQLVSRLNITTIYVTHDQVEALSMSDRIAVMNKGMIIQEGSPRDLYLRPSGEFVADFLGKSNFLTGCVIEHETQLRTGVVETKLGFMQCTALNQVSLGDTVLLGVRPSGFKVNRTASPSENGNSFTGTIESINFVGDFQECHVLAAGEVLKVILDPYEDLQVGQSIRLNVPAERLTIIGKM